MKQKFDIEGEEHITTGECNEGFCGSKWYPKKCECGGTIHGRFIEADYSGISAHERCDACGKGGVVRLE